MEADRQIIASYMQQDNFTDALNLCTMLPQLYNLTGDALTEHSNYMQMLTLYQTLYAEGRQMTELTASEKDMLYNHANNSLGTAGTLAQGILTAYYNETYIDCFELSEQASYKRGSINPATLAKIYGMEISVKPNPATTWAAFDYALPEGETSATLFITDPTGKVIETLPLTGNQGQKLWDTRTIKPSAYVYQMTSGTKSLTGKLIIVK
jgi:hypothetical protein